VSSPGSGNGGRTLSRDFKHVKRHATTRGNETFSGWMGLGVGLAVGLSVALAVFLHYRGQPPAEPVAKAEATPQSDAASDETTVVGPASDDLTFYDILQKQGVEVPPESKGKPAATARSAAPGGEATIQAGSFKQQAEAEKQIARLVSLGINARIVKVPMDDETWYRVQIGPIETVQELEDVRRKLDDAEIESTAVAPSSRSPTP
jgi:cell division protein FtsN